MSASSKGREEGELSVEEPRRLFIYRTSHENKVQQSTMTRQSRAPRALVDLAKHPQSHVYLYI